MKNRTNHDHRSIWKNSFRPKRLAFLAWLLVLLAATAMLPACGAEDDSSSNSDQPADDDALDDDLADDDVADDDAADDDAADDDAADDDAVDDDVTDDDVTDDDVTDDDTFVPDDYVAPWPQANIEPNDYDESGTAGELREKAGEYDAWHLANHQPYYGCTVGTAFTDATRTTVAQYFDFNDSCEWTGLYLGSQSFRYYVTGDAQAKTNAIRTVHALSGNLHVNDKPGFISRFHAEQDPLIYPGDTWCDAPEQARCHRVEDGPYADSWWWGETSRDMYNGWFFGMAVAFDLVDDEDMRDLIRADVTEVLDELLDSYWWIIDEAGLPTDSAPHVGGPMRVAWILIGYHITGDDRYRAELQKWLTDEARITLRMMSITFMNHYAQYYGNCLNHELWYNLLRLGKVYFSADDYDFYLQLFETQMHSFVRLSHNPWFNGVFMGQGDYHPEAKDDEYPAQLLGDLTDFRDAPLYRYYLPDRNPATYTLDPLAVLLHDLMEQFPFLEELMGSVNYQAQEAFPILEQCTTDFLFQRNPFKIYECGSDNPEIVNPGVDYLISYWLASYHKFAPKEM